MFIPPTKAIFKILDANRHRLIGTKNSATHKRILNEILAEFGVFCSVQSLFDVYTEYKEFGVLKFNNVQEHAIVLLGFFYGHWTRKKNVELVLCYPYGKMKFEITEEYWQQFRLDITQFVSHELIHRNQIERASVGCDERRTKSFAIMSGRREVFSDSEKNWVDYYAESDEIGATAHCVAMDLAYKTNGKEEAYRILRQPTSIIWNNKASGLMAIVIYYFGRDVSSAASKRFLKTVYLQLEEIFTNG